MSYSGRRAARAKSVHAFVSFKVNERVYIVNDWNRRAWPGGNRALPNANYTIRWSTPPNVKVSIGRLRHKVRSIVLT